MIKLKIINGSGEDFTKEVESFVNDHEVIRTSFTSGGIFSAFIEYKEELNGAKTREPRVQAKNNTGNKKRRKQSENV